jgi:AbrB family looped-hinge helix DNA binding protein
MHCKKIADCFYGTATVGERGQIVIPVEARQDLGINPGDKLLMMKHPQCSSLMVAKIENVISFFDEMTRQLQQIDSEEADS